jgi:hypothetical protein
LHLNRRHNIYVCGGCERRKTKREEVQLLKVVVVTAVQAKVLLLAGSRPKRRSGERKRVGRGGR